MATYSFGQASSLNAPDLRHFNQIQLARRWSLSPRTLERWRWLRQGPEYLKIGGRVVYRAEDVVAFEAAQLHRTAGTNLRSHKPT